jgi:hypothetical protein
MFQYTRKKRIEASLKKELNKLKNVKKSVRKQEIELIVRLLCLQKIYPSAQQVTELMWPKRSALSSEENRHRHKIMKRLRINLRKNGGKGSEYEYPENQTTDDDFFYKNEEYDG